MTHRTSTASSLLVLVLAAPLATSLAAQGSVYRISIDSQGPTIGTIDSATGTPITAGDILGPFGGALSFSPAGTPGIVVSAGPLGLKLPLYGACTPPPHPALLSACPMDVDALCNGLSLPVQPTALQCGRIRFSTDEWARGIVDATVPSLHSEGLMGALEASADTFVARDLPAPPLDSSTIGSNVGTVDGDGQVSGAGALYLGMGLIEPNTPGVPPDQGDNIDALMVGPADQYPIYFSLDGDLIDPLTGIASNDSAVLNGFQPGDVLVTSAAGIAPILYATATQLGLGPTDDLDALALWENGDGVFTPSVVEFDWLTVGPLGKDMLIFSVRRGSPIIGTPDSHFGQPICEGDLLTTPRLLATVPALFISAEALGLLTDRSPGGVNDDLSALSIAPLDSQIKDCNHNGCEDSLDCKSGKSRDLNQNQVPDECETGLGNAYCVSGTNSTGSAAKISATGSVSVSANDLVLDAQPVPNAFGIFFFGLSPTSIAFGNGTLCVAPPLKRLPPVFAVGNIMTQAFDNTTPQPPFAVNPGTTLYFQAWFRDVAGGGAGFNLSDGLELTFRL